MPDDLFDRLKKEAEGNGERADGPRSRFVRGTTLSHRQWLQLDLERQILRKKWADFFGNVDVLICPAAPVAAFPHDHGKLYDRTLPVNGKMRSYFDTLYTWSGLTGVAYLPSTALPVGCTAEGLPVGAQIVGPYLADRTTISAAALIEEALGGFVPPPNLSDV